MQKRKAIKFKSQKFSYIKKGSRMYILKVAFPLLKKYKTKKKIPWRCRPLPSENLCQISWNSNQKYKN